MMFLLCFLAVSSAGVVEEHNTRAARLNILLDVARAERRVIQLLAGTSTLHPDLIDFLDFMKEDSGHPWKVTEEESLLHPLDRFKVVERLIYDWPVFANILASTGSDLDLMKMFAETTQGQLPDWDDLIATVGELNSVMVDYAVNSDEAISSATEIPMNTGNLLVLTNISHNLGAYAECVMWGSRADTTLLQSDEPFTIPGEKYWLDQYLTYLRCLVLNRETANSLKMIEVREEILTHYNTNPRVRQQVDDITHKDPIDPVSTPPTLQLECVEERLSESWIPGRVLRGKDLLYLLDQSTNAHSSQSATGLAHSSNSVLVYNSKYFDIIVETQHYGTLVVHPGCTLIGSVNEILHIHTPLIGYVELYSA